MNVRGGGAGKPGLALSSGAGAPPPVEGVGAQGSQQSQGANRWEMEKEHAEAEVMPIQVRLQRPRLQGQCLQRQCMQRQWLQGQWLHRGVVRWIGLLGMDLWGGMLDCKGVVAWMCNAT